MMKKLIISFLFLMVSLPLFAQEKGTLSFFSGVVAELAKKSLFEVALGKAWFRVEKIRGKEIEVRTPTAVVGVRGTIFSVEVRDGITLLDVLKGMVEALIKEKSFIVRGGEGLRADPAGPVRRKLTSEEKKEFIKELAPPPAGKERGNLQREIRKIKAEVAAEKVHALQVKDRDFSAGRSMRDRWGNLVRVEQHLYRPDNYSLRFFNINKRDTNKEDVTKFNYLKNEIVFNKELPEDISKWPQWIANEIEEDKEVSTTNFEEQNNLQPQETTRASSTLHPKWMETIISNGTPNDKDADRMKWESEWDRSKGELGEAKFFIDKGGDGQIEYAEYSNNWKTIAESERDGGEKLCSKERARIYMTDGTTSAGELLISSALINNDGNIMTEERLEKVGIFEALAETGFEYRIENAVGSTLLNKPIDIIFTADIIIAALKELAGAVTAATIEAK